MQVCGVELFLHATPPHPQKKQTQNWKSCRFVRACMRAVSNWIQKRMGHINRCLSLSVLGPSGLPSPLWKSKWTRNEIWVISDWNRSEREVKLKWDRSRIVVTSKWNRREFDVISTWNQIEIWLESKWRLNAIDPTYHWSRSETEVQSKRHRSKLEVTPKWTRSGIELKLNWNPSDSHLLFEFNSLLF